MKLVILFALFALIAAVEKCGPNEKMYECGACDSTCDVEMNCNLKCRTPECGCVEGYKRNDANVCIQAAKCP
ncbi:hypothetical protein L596_013714 [Steinernema carpocapsae]|uniref:TIL domain-containing protein n=1 Tax=Steinernema carpocapsae TaxID=34508 RepID=A0A4V6A565_STECR|nr:hypothetical protein L596_013714 [Steinernema carpocapsae]